MKKSKASKKPVRIVIYVSGGLVQDVLAEDKGVEAMIVDYDNEECARPEELPAPRGSHGQSRVH